MKYKSFFIIYEGLSLKEIKEIFSGRWESDFKFTVYIQQIPNPPFNKTPRLLITLNFSDPSPKLLRPLLY